MSKTINERTYQVTCSQDVKPEWFVNCKSVGISAGASTPDYLINDVAKNIKKIETHK